MADMRISISRETIAVAEVVAYLGERPTGLLLDAPDRFLARLDKTLRTKSIARPPQAGQVKSANRLGPGS